ncbi:HD domain-containing protein [Psychrosphaera ytuae]|nr:HD domain-containing protein [Psychrosphaera ytuae]
MKSQTSESVQSESKLNSDEPSSLLSLDFLEEACQKFMLEQVVHDTAHDINHIKRVVKNAKQIAVDEQADIWVVTAAAWLHDCVTFPKNHPDNKRASGFAAKAACEFLSSIGFPENKLAGVFHAVEAHSYSANITATSLEAKVVQDADRLDGLGAVGVARCYAVAGKLGSKLYNEHDPFCQARQPDSKTAAVDHFYEKLFKTATTLQTATAKRIAEQRVEFMEDFLTQLRTEIS